MQAVLMLYIFVSVPYEGEGDYFFWLDLCCLDK